MLMFRSVTAQHFAAALTNAEMHPATIDLDTFLTTKYGVIRFRDQAVRSQRIKVLAAHRDFWEFE